MQTMRERLEKIVRREVANQLGFCGASTSGPVVDAVLEELREPDEGMIAAGDKARLPASSIFTVMIDHALKKER